MFFNKQKPLHLTHQFANPLITKHAKILEEQELRNKQAKIQEQHELRNEMRDMIGLPPLPIEERKFTYIVDFCQIVSMLRYEVPRAIASNETNILKQIEVRKYHSENYSPITFLDFLVERFFNNETYKINGAVAENDGEVAKAILTNSGVPPDTAEHLVHVSFMMLAGIVSILPLGFESNDFRSVRASLIDEFGSVGITYHFYNNEDYGNALSIFNGQLGQVGQGYNPGVPLSGWPSVPIQGLPASDFSRFHVSF